MDDDQLVLLTAGSVIDLLKKQEIGLSSAEGDTCERGWYADSVGHGSRPSAG